MVGEPSSSPVAIEVAGLSVEVRTRGAGRDILFLHPEIGFDGADGALDALAVFGRVTAPSHPGFGASQLPDWMSSVDDVSYFYLDLLAKLDLRDVLLVGASFGGWIAAEIAVKNTGRVSGLVLAGSTGIRVGDRDRRDMVDIFDLTRAECDAVTFHDPARAPALPSAATPKEEVEVFARNRESLTLFAWSPYMHSPHLRYRLHRIDVPTLVLWGAEDKFTKPDYGRAFAAAIPDARFQTIAGAGHFPHIETPVEFAAAVSSVQRRG